jgi:autotransporter-associated beta strand protein
VGAGTASLTKAGNGVLVLAGANVYTGTTSSECRNPQAKRDCDHSGCSALTSFAIVRQNAVLDINGAGFSTLLYAGGPSLPLTNLGALTGSGLVDNFSNTPVALSLNGTSTGVFSGLIQNSIAAGSLALIRNAASGTQYLTGLNPTPAPRS